MDILEKIGDTIVNVGKDVTRCIRNCKTKT